WNLRQQQIFQAGSGRIVHLARDSSLGALATGSGCSLASSRSSRSLNFSGTGSRAMAPNISLNCLPICACRSGSSVGSIFFLFLPLSLMACNPRQPTHRPATAEPSRAPDCASSVTPTSSLFDALFRRNSSPAKMKNKETTCGLALTPGLTLASDEAQTLERRSRRFVPLAL